MRAITASLLFSRSLLPALLVAACEGGAPATTSIGETGPDPATSSAGTSTTLDPSTSTSIDPDTSTSVDPDTSTSVDPDTSTSSTDTSTSTGGPGCGNGELDDGEDCDGDFLDGEDCLSEDFDGGTLSCQDDCTFDYSLCTTVCGDGEIHGLEQCEADDLDGQDCVTQGFDEGILTCTAECMFDLSDCASFVCGNDLVQGKEVCDGTELLGEDCDSQGFGVGVLACADDCTAFDTSNCMPTVCGDNAQAGDEVCDGIDLDDETCETQGFGPGVLTCTDDCAGFDTSQCSEPVDPECNGGAMLMAQNPAADQVVCDDPNDATCEQDAELLCPTGWGLCTRDQHNNRNDGFDYAVGGGNPVVVGEIHCRAGNGAGHFTLGPYDNISNLDQDVPLLNCGYGSSRSACPTGYGCNELVVQALCCAPDPLCGNGVVDLPEEQCDDANADESDECLDSCSWRVPSDHGMAC